MVLNDFRDSNTNGLFWHQATGICHMTNERRSIWGYTLVEHPLDGMMSFCHCCKTIQQLMIITRNSIVACGITTIVNLTSKTSLQSSAMQKQKLKQQLWMAGRILSMVLLQVCLCQRYPGIVQRQRNTVLAFQMMMVASKKFLKQLQQANRTVDGCKDMVEDKHDSNNFCSSYNVFIIWQRFSIPCVA